LTDSLIYARLYLEKDIQLESCLRHRTHQFRLPDDPAGWIDAPTQGHLKTLIMKITTQTLHMSTGSTATTF